MLIAKIKLRRIMPVLALSGMVLFTACDQSTDSAEEVKEDVKKEMAAAKESVKETASMDESKRMVYTIVDVDRQPLFGLECPVQDDPVECSNQEIIKFVKENAEFPKMAQRKGQDGFEQVVVVVEKDGSLSDLKYAASSKSQECEGCQKAAVDVVGKMKGWTPGMKDGMPVAVQITIPVKFESS